MHADYLLRCFEMQAAQSTGVRWHGFASTVLRYPICTPPVFKAILRHPLCPPIAPPSPSQRAITILPRRLFRHLEARLEGSWTDEDEPLPFLRFLETNPRVPRLVVDSFEGYALTRAVYAGHVPLIRFLLALGASPEMKDNLAVTVAIRKKNLSLVRMLIERDGPGAAAAEPTTSGLRKRKRIQEDDGGEGTSNGASGSKGTHAPKSAKRRKLGDRVTVNPAMLKVAVQCDARDIVEYFMKEKGCSPDMKTMTALMMR